MPSIKSRQGKFKKTPIAATSTINSGRKQMTLSHETVGVKEKCAMWKVKFVVDLLFPRGFKLFSPNFYAIQSPVIVKKSKSLKKSSTFEIAYV